jgi:hypothetical protein
MINTRIQQIFFAAQKVETCNRSNTHYEIIELLQIDEFSYELYSQQKLDRLYILLEDMLFLRNSCVWSKIINTNVLPSKNLEI